jgi:O-antigen ligase
MVAVILTDRDPVEAIKTLIRRCTFVLVPLSVLVVKYYPAIGRATHRYSDETSYNGVAVGSNGLATTCFICALLVVWSLIRKGSLTNKTDFGINALMLVMIVWLMQKADGATSLAALLMGAALLLMLRLDVFGRQVLSVGRNFGMVLIVMAPIVVINYSWLIDIAGLLFGRSETLWGRLEVWRRAIRLVTNPFVGMGYNSFWQGDRLEAMWSVYWWRPTQAHNGYVETYLNLGLVGVMLLAAVIFTACRKAARTGLPDELQYLKLAYLLPIVFYNLNEAAFRGLHVAWFTFLLFSIEARGPSAPLTLSRARTKRYGRTVTNTKIALPQ